MLLKLKKKELKRQLLDFDWNLSLSHSKRASNVFSEFFQPIDDGGQVGLDKHFVAMGESLVTG
ncbi:MAG: hypothetical protein ACREHD_21335, partial [Pirellulales bacterium]